MFAELGQALRDAIAQYKAGDPKRARTALDETAVAYFDLQAEALRTLPLPALEKQLEQCAADEREKYRLLADMLLLDGDLLYEDGQAEAALYAWQRSLFILQWMQGNVETVFSFSRQGRLQELTERIARVSQ